MRVCVFYSDVWCYLYLLYTAQLVHGSLVVLHAVFSQLQVGRVLNRRYKSVSRFILRYMFMVSLHRYHSPC